MPDTHADGCEWKVVKDQKETGRNEKISLEVNITILQKYVKRRAMTTPEHWSENERNTV